jgi:hypothetical protein
MPAQALEEEAADRPPKPPRGRWRLAAREELDAVVLWMSHIMIRHDQVKNDNVPFDLTDWKLDAPTATRTRAEALNLARDIQAALHADHAHFDALANQLSEDWSSREVGGALGGLRASRFLSWPTVLDAIQAAGPDGLTEIVETNYGYHVFQIATPPPNDLVSGERIVIAHASAPWLAKTARGPLPHRTRNEARSRAEDVYRQATTEQADFMTLARLYSEHWSADAGGFMGTWGSREPPAYPLQTTLLQRAKLGEVLAPVQTLFGYEILRRIPPRVSKRYAASMLTLYFDTALPPGQNGSEQTMRQLAELLNERLKRAPIEFSALQKQYCCTGVVEEVAAGRSNPALVAAITDLEPGQISSTVVREGRAWSLVLRLDDATLPPVQLARPALPSPTEPNIDRWLAGAEESALVFLFASIANQTAGELGLEPDTADRLIAIHDIATRLKGAHTSARLNLVNEVRGDSHELLGERYSTYDAVMRRHVEEHLLRSGT